MKDLRELKDIIDEWNYTEDELKILHGEVMPSDEERNKLIIKVIRLGDVEYTQKLLNNE